MSGILEGLKVIDMGHVVAIPSSGAVFADWGAEVIKVEPLIGEMMRGLGRSARNPGFLQVEGGEVNWRIQLFNRNKRGIAVDLTKESGRSIIYKLVQSSDAFMTNYELGALNKLKMDYETLSQYNPAIIYAVLTGYGTKGPDKDERGFDYAAGWARSGMQYLLGQPGCPPPQQRGGVMDRVAGFHVVTGILAALHHREKTGEGQKIEFSLYHSGVWTLAADIQGALVGLPLPQHDHTMAGNPLANTYRTKDGRWFILAMLQSDLQWPSFLRAIDKVELKDDPRFNSMEKREENCVELIRILDEVFATKTLEEWEKRFKVDNLIYGRIQTPTEVTTDPQALVNDFFAEIDHPLAGKLKLVTTPVKFCQNPAAVKTSAPEVGQHTEELLLELGYSWEDIAQLKDEGAIL